MAKTPAKQPAVVVENNSEKRPFGRPPGAKNHPVDSTGKKFDFNATGQTFRKPIDFYKFLEGYPNKTGLQAYIYRLRPSIDLTLTGHTEFYIWSSSNEAEMREDFIANKFGRGHYQLKMSDANKPKGLSQVCKITFEIDDPDIEPPIYDPRTLKLADPKNTDEVARLLQLGVLVDDGGGKIRVRNMTDTSLRGAGPASPGGLLDNNLVGEILKSLISRGAQSPSDAVKDSIAIAQLMNNAGSSKNDLEAIVERVVAKLQPAQRSELSLFDAYEKVQGFLDRAVGGRRGNPTAGGDGARSAETAAHAGENGNQWAPFLSGILSEGRLLVADLMTGYREVRAMHSTNGAPMPQQPNGQPQPQMLKPLDQRIEDIARDGLGRMRQGTSGFDFAAYICNFVPGGIEVFETLSPMGTTGLIAMIAMKPGMGSFVNENRDQLTSFLDDFFSFDPEGTPADDGAGAAAGAAASS